MALFAAILSFNIWAWEEYYIENELVCLQHSLNLIKKIRSECEVPLPGQLSQELKALQDIIDGSRVLWELVLDYSHVEQQFVMSMLMLNLRIAKCHVSSLHIKICRFCCEDIFAENEKKLNTGRNSSRKRKRPRSASRDFSILSIATVYSLILSSKSCS